jgi:hypothetical protein
LPVGALNVGGGRNPGAPGATGAMAVTACSGDLMGAPAGVMGRVAVTTGAAATVGVTERVAVRGDAGATVDVTGAAATVGVFGPGPVTGRVPVLAVGWVMVGVNGD